MPELLRAGDLRLLTTLLSPGHVIAAARDHGMGDPILGADAAYAEIRGSIRSYARHLIERGRRQFDRSEAKRAIRAALGGLGYTYPRQSVLPFSTQGTWRDVALACWTGPCEIRGTVEFETACDKPSRVVLAVLRVLADVLDRSPHLNRAVLDGRVWQRVSAEIMVHAELRQDLIAPIVVSPAGKSEAEIAMELRRALRASLKAEASPYVVAGRRLMADWCRAGFIASPAAAMVSDLTRLEIRQGDPVLIPANGIPVSVGVCLVTPHVYRLSIVGDHRAIDASHGSELHAALRSGVPALLRGEAW